MILEKPELLIDDCGRWK